MKTKLSFLICVVALTTFLSSLASAQSDAVCREGSAAASSSGGYVRAMSIWAENSIDASTKMKLRAVLDCLELSELTSGNEASFDWISTRAKEDIVDAKVYLALLYGTGIGVKANMKHARYWLREAARDGSEAAGFLLEALNSGELLEEQR